MQKLAGVGRSWHMLAEAGRCLQKLAYAFRSSLELTRVRKKLQEHAKNCRSLQYIAGPHRSL